MAGTHCVLPQRVDVGMQFVKTGGIDGLRETYDALISRTSSFGQYNFVTPKTIDDEKHKLARDLFQNEKFSQVAKEVCPPHKQTMDPFQYNFIVNLPGQAVPIHLDAPWFVGADRSSFPQWLLVAMTFSGLFQERFVDQVQVVAYLHDWEPTAEQMGQFVYFSNNTVGAAMVAPLPRAGSAVDGSKLVHTARTYSPKSTLPKLPKDKESKIVFHPHPEETKGTWNLQVDGETVQAYTGNDLRISMVYRARCFESPEVRAAYHAHNTTFHDLTTDEIMDAFRTDLTAKGYSIPADMLDLALLIIKVYIKYPLPAASIRWNPLNYCALPRLYPSVAPLINLIC